MKTTITDLAATLKLNKFTFKSIQYDEEDHGNSNFQYLYILFVGERTVDIYVLYNKKFTVIHFFTSTEFNTQNHID